MNHALTSMAAKHLESLLTADFQGAERKRQCLKELLTNENLRQAALMALGIFEVGHPVHRGLNEHRLSENPREQAFAEMWRERNDHGDILGYLLGDGQQTGFVSHRDALVAATVIQWLGSPVGRGFLAETDRKHAEMEVAAKSQGR